MIGLALINLMDMKNIRPTDVFSLLYGYVSGAFLTV